MFYVYVIKRVSSGIYIGFTTDLRRRLKEHKTKWEGSSLIYYEAYHDEKLARMREKQLKIYGSAYRGLRRRLKV